MWRFTEACGYVLYNECYTMLNRGSTRLSSKRKQKVECAFNRTYMVLLLQYTGITAYRHTGIR